VTWLLLCFNIVLLVWLIWRSPTPWRVDAIVNEVRHRLDELDEQQKDLFALVRAAIAETHGADKAQAVEQWVKEQRIWREDARNTSRG